MKITTAYLTGLGFAHIYDPLIKGYDFKKLTYIISFEAGYISIKLQLSNEWELQCIGFMGEHSFKVLIQEIGDSLTLVDIISLVKKYPIQTF